MFVGLGVWEKNKKYWTKNEAIEMMHTNTANALKAIADAVKRWEYDSDEIIDFLIESAEVLEAQALTVSLRDELGYDFPVDDK